MLTHTKAKRIYHKFNHTTRNVKEINLGRKKIIGDGNMNLEK